MQLCLRQIPLAYTPMCRSGAQIFKCRLRTTSLRCYQSAIAHGLAASSRSIERVGSGSDRPLAVSGLGSLQPDTLRWKTMPRKLRGWHTAFMIVRCRNKRGLSRTLTL